MEAAPVGATLLIRAQAVAVERVRGTATEQARLAPGCAAPMSWTLLRAAVHDLAWFQDQSGFAPGAHSPQGRALCPVACEGGTGTATARFRWR